MEQFEKANEYRIFFYFKSYNNDQRKIYINPYIEKNLSKTNNLRFKFKKIGEEEKNKNPK